MPKALSVSFAFLAMLVVGCSQREREVSHPFYVMTIADSYERALFRCPEGPDGGCAIDGLPGPDVFAAGANASYVVVARHRASQDEYFYFRRIPDEKQGWGASPERIVGPLEKSQFEAEAKRLGLPELVSLPG